MFYKVIVCVDCDEPFKEEPVSPQWFFAHCKDMELIPHFSEPEKMFTRVDGICVRGYFGAVSCPACNQMRADQGMPYNC